MGVEAQLSLESRGVFVLVASRHRSVIRRLCFLLPVHLIDNRIVRGIRADLAGRVSANLARMDQSRMLRAISVFRIVHGQ
jgi:hypothetical protein